MTLQTLIFKPQHPSLSNQRYFYMVSRWRLQKTHPSYEGVRADVNAPSISKVDPQI